MVSNYLPSGSKIGVGYQAHALATALVERGHRLTMFSSCPPVDGARYEHRQVVLHGALRTFRFAGRLRSIDFSGFDVLHAHGDDYWLWRRRCPVHVRTMHGSCFEEALHIPGAKEKLRMVALGLTEVLATVVADRTVLVSPGTRRWTPWVRSVIPNGIDSNRFRPDAAPPSAHPTILFVGTWHNRKRGAELARIFAQQVRPAVPGAELLMVSQDTPDLLPAGVRALGRLDDEQLARAYAAAWVFCLPSDYEGFGIPYAEAMAAGTPVVATPNLGARYVLDDGSAGVIADLDELGPALVRVLTDAGWRADLGRRALDRSRSFGLDTIAASYERVYRRDVPPAGHPFKARISLRERRSRAAAKVRSLRG